MAHTKTGRLFTELILEVFRFNGILIEAGDKLIKDLGLTSARWQVLGSLVDGPLPVADIGRRMGLSRQNVQRIANRLQKDGFLDTSPNPAHRRAKLYFLTQFGVEVIEEITKRQEKWVNQLSKDMDLANLNTSLSLLSDSHSRVKKSINL